MISRFIFNLDSEIEKTDNIKKNIEILEGVINNDLTYEYSGTPCYDVCGGEEPPPSDEEKQFLLKSFELCLTFIKIFKLYQKEIIWEGDNFYVQINFPSRFSERNFVSSPVLNEKNPYGSMSFHPYKDNTFGLLKTKYIRAKEPNEYGIYIIKNLDIDSKCYLTIDEVINDVKPYLDLPLNN